MIQIKKPPLLIDKNILQGWPEKRIQELASRYELLMPDVLFFELMSTNPQARARCFRMLPEGHNPIVLVDHIGAHLKYELAHGIPMGRPSDHPLEMKYRFHPELRNVTYTLPDEVVAQIAEENEALRERVKDFIERALTVENMVKRIIEADDLSQPAAIEQLRQEALDLRIVRSFMEGFEPPEGELALPDLAVADETSAILRHTQAHLLFAIDAWHRYGKLLQKEPMSEKFYTSLEHDVLDAEYLALAVLEGSFATEERKLRTMFRQLCPGGLLIPEKP
jgi:hypothetical protein